MATRYVTRSGKDGYGDITKLCNSGEPWSPRLKADAISDIENKVHDYYVSWNDGQVTQIKVVNGQTGKYLRTQRDGTTKNNLDDLPDC
jgi:hypothetical protein